jgi:hypothetical protein
MLVAASLSQQEHELWKDFLDVAPSGELPWRS